MQTNCTLIAKVVKNARLGTVRVLFTFDKDAKLTVVNALAVSGDVCRLRDADANQQIANEVAGRMQALRCTNVRMQYSKDTERVLCK